MSGIMLFLFEVTRKKYDRTNKDSMFKWTKWVGTIFWLWKLNSSFQTFAHFHRRNNCLFVANRYFQFWKNDRYNWKKFPLVVLFFFAQHIKMKAAKLLMHQVWTELPFWFYFVNTKAFKPKESFSKAFSLHYKHQKLEMLYY